LLPDEHQGERHAEEGVDDRDQGRDRQRQAEGVPYLGSGQRLGERPPSPGQDLMG
jgi:hypothetical protein